MPEASADLKETPRHTHNAQALIALWSAVGAVVLLLMFVQIRGRVLLLAVPTAGLNATIYGVIGFVKSGGAEKGRLESLIGLTVGIIILLTASAIGLLVWALGRANWQF